MAHSAAFKRMIVGLPTAAGEYALVDTAARLAELLRLELVAMIADDLSLARAAGLPCVRELRPLGGGWQAIDTGRFSTELKQSTDLARRLFTEIACRCGVESSFRIEEGSAADAIGSMATAEDIVVVIEPRNPAERVTQQFVGLMESALRAAASVMIVPSRVARRSGPIVAIAATEADPSVEVALGIAGAVNETSLVIGPQQLAPTIAKAMAAFSGRVEFEAVKMAAVTASNLAGDLQRRGERLIVLSRGTLEIPAVRMLASLRSVPVMILEPKTPAPAQTAVR